GFVHRLDLVLKTRRGRRHAKLIASAYHYSRACHCGSIDSSDKCTCLIPTADADRSRLASDPGVGNIDVAIAYGEIFAGPGSNSRVPGAGGVQSECGNPFCSVAATTGIVREGAAADSCIVVGRVSKQRTITDSSVVGTFAVGEEGERPVRCIVASSRII